MTHSTPHACRPSILKGMTLLLILILNLPSAQVLTQTAFPGDGELVVKVLVGSSLRISGRTLEEIEIVAKTARPLRAVDWSWLNREEHAVFTLEKSVQGEIEIRVPQGVRLVVESRAGSIILDGLKGTVAGRLGCGNLTLLRLSGVVDLQSDCGDVRVEHCRAIGQVVALDGQLWSEDVSPDLVLGTGFGGARFQVNKPEGTLKLDSQGADLWVSSRWGNGFISVRADDGFVQIDAASQPLTLDVQNGGFDITDAGNNIDLQLVNGRGRLSVGKTMKAVDNWRLKCVDAILTLLDPKGLIGGVMLALQENKEGRQDLFLGMPFDMLTEIKQGSTLQLRRLPSGSDIKAELRSTALILPSVETEIKNRRIK